MSDLYNAGLDKVVDLGLSQRSENQILRVEYSWRKRCRVFFYYKVVREIHKKLEAAMNAVPPSNTIMLYLSDEGVWSEIVKDIIRKVHHKGVMKMVLVEHGLHHVEGTPKLIAFRRMLNMVTRFIAGFPVVGYGLCGSQLDVYLFFTKKAQVFLRERIAGDVFACPLLIKRDFIEEYHNESNKTDSENRGLQVMFAMSPLVPACGIKCTETELYESFSEVIKLIASVTKEKIIFRPHPGMDYNNTSELLSTLSYRDVARIDANECLVNTLIGVDFVISVNSSTLFDAWIVGKVPVQLMSEHEDRALPFDLETIDVRCATIGMIKRVFSPKTIAKYKSGAENISDDVKWMEYLKVDATLEEDLVSFS